MAQNILLIEDESLTRANLAALLKAQGYAVTEASDGVTGIELMGHHEFDLVIADFVLPKLHGFHLVDILKAKWPGIPIIIISGYLSEKAAKVILGKSADFISKPVDMETLLATIRGILGPSSVSGATMYRKKADSEIWHLCSTCSDWPKNDYEDQLTPPGTGMLCNECQVKREKSDCQ